MSRMWLFLAEISLAIPLPPAIASTLPACSSPSSCVAGNDVWAPNLGDKSTRGSACAPLEFPATRRLPIFVDIALHKASVTTDCLGSLGGLATLRPDQRHNMNYVVIREFDPSQGLAGPEYPGQR